MGFLSTLIGQEGNQIQVPRPILEASSILYA